MIQKTTIAKYKNQEIIAVEDVVAIEEPLEIQLEFGKTNNRKTQSLSVTMRTPENDEELAIGFLFTEGIITALSNLAQPVSKSVENNKIIIRLAENFNPELEKIKRNFYTTSSCGVCGKESIQAIFTKKEVLNSIKNVQLDAHLFGSLPNKLAHIQKTFIETGGIHAAALFDFEGELLLFREDVGRHNALDKLIGAVLLNQQSLDYFKDKIVLLSGRASFELIQKAAMAGIPVVSAIGAPSSLAIDTAQSFDMTLIGFLKNNSFNIYSGKERIKEIYEN